MTWADFWALIATLNGEATHANCRRLAQELSRRPVSYIIGFAERHAEALYRLNQEKFGTLPVIDLTARDGRPFPQSSDGFRYARCAVVAAGRAVWRASSPTRTSSFRTPPPSVTANGCCTCRMRRTSWPLARKWDRTTRYCFESYSNRDGRPDMPD
ncbi:DUF4240 domain-containing protein [Streptomyces sp. ICN441]|uniref:DUF4240 domain-containing protein n=1 Tax=Streptomyces sp. ICN441 TaxID=2558286 RepID=UPI001F0D6053|nr:DUF4240 domain-containing protein [Streptomyces sp. ICN441]